MDLQTVKYISIPILLLSTLFMTLIGICLQRYILHRGSFLTLTQTIVSSITGGIFLGTLLLFILPNAIDLVRTGVLHIEAFHHFELGYFLVGLGFFLICIFKEITRAIERRNQNKNIEKEQLITIGTTQHDHTTTIRPIVNQTIKETNERIIILVCALGIHYFFNGVLVGGQINVETLWLVLSAIVFHMSLVAFSVTIRLLVDNQDYIKIFGYMTFWSCMGPLGVLVSLVVTSSDGLNLINGVLQCISAGTFVYITFLDMLYNDLMQAKLYPFVNMILVFIGYIIIVLISFWHHHP